MTATRKNPSSDAFSHNWPSPKRFLKTFFYPEAGQNFKAVRLFFVFFLQDAWTKTAKNAKLVKTVKTGDFSAMKPGDSFDCPHCGRNSFLKKESVMDGWKKTGEVLKCASCSAWIADLPWEEASAAGKKGVGNTAAGKDAAPSPEDALKKLLGTDEEEDNTKNAEFLKEKLSFCRDCAHMVSNAFRLYCTKWDRDVNPMDDCPAHTPRTGSSEGKKGDRP